MRLDSFDNMRPFGVELGSISVMRLLLALYNITRISPELFIQSNEPPFRLFQRTYGRTYVFQTVALVVLKQAVGSAVVAIAETTVPNDSLRALLTIFVCTADLLGWHAAAERHGHVESCLSIDVVVCQGTR